AVPLGAEDRGGEGILRDLGAKVHDGGERCVEVERDVLHVRPHLGREFPVTRGHGHQAPVFRPGPQSLSRPPREIEATLSSAPRRPRRRSASSRASSPYFYGFRPPLVKGPRDRAGPLAASTGR